MAYSIQQSYDEKLNKKPKECNFILHACIMKHLPLLEDQQGQSELSYAVMSATHQQVWNDPSLSELLFAPKPDNFKTYNKYIVVLYKAHTDNY